MQRRRDAVRATRVTLIALLCALAGCAGGPRSQDVAVEYFNVGNAYFELAQYDKAVQYYRDALRFDPTLTDADNNLALSLIRLQQTAEAMEILNGLIVKDPQNVTVLKELGWAQHVAGKDEDAIARFDAVLKLSPQDKDAVYNRALILWKLDRKQDAIDAFKSILVFAPDDQDTLYDLGSLSLSLDDPQAALDYIDRYLQKKADDVDAQYLLADCDERLEKYSQALAAYDAILAISAKEANAWFGKARLLLTVVEDPDKGLEALTQALQLGFHDMDAVKVLLSSADLQDRPDVEAALKKRNMLPPDETAPPDKKTEGQTPK